ncbi:MAG: Gfo/Idh/MocA family oxidoreductase [Kiritimatiellia bacterium]
MNTENNNRRDFMKLALASAGAAATGGCASLIRTKPVRRAFAAPMSTAPPRLALVGVGGAGAPLLRYFSASGALIAAICDVDERELSTARELLAPRFPDLQTFQDYRVMFDTLGTLDGAVIATPDHGHAMQALRALQAGCHLYLETPVTHTLQELATLEGAVHRARRHLFCGELNIDCEPALRGRAGMATGVIGKISQVHIWSNGPIWPQGGVPPSGSDPVPAGLAWDLWLAGAQPRPYKRFVYHKFNWRGWCDFGGGTLGDAGCQLLSFPFATLELSVPKSVTRLNFRGGTDVSYPQSTTLRWVCNSAIQRDRVELFWYDGGALPVDDLLQQARATLGRLPGSGVLLVGERGTWLVAGTACQQHYLGFIGSPRMIDFERHALWNSLTVPPSRSVTAPARFLRAISSGERCDFNLTAQPALHKAVLIGALASRGVTGESCI